MHIVYFLLLFISILLGFFVLFSNHQRSENLFFFVWILGVSIWTFGNYMIFNASDVLFWNRTAYLGGTILILGFTGFFLEYPYPRLFPDWKRIVTLVLPALAVMPFVYTPLVISDMIGASSVVFGSMHGVWIVFFILYFSVGSAAFVQSLKYLQQALDLKLVFIGFVLSLLLGVTTNLIFPVVFGITDFYQIGPLFSLIVNSFVVYVIFKHQLLNIKVFVNKFFSTLITLAVFVLGFMIVVWVYTLFIATQFFMSFYVFSALYICFTALSFQSLRLRLQSTSAKLFLSSHYNSNDVLTRFASMDHFSFNLKSLVNKINVFFLDELELDHIECFFPQNFEYQRQFSETLICYSDQARVFPLEILDACKQYDGSVIKCTDLTHVNSWLNSFSYILKCSNGEDVLGVICLGKKLSEQSFYKDDVALFETFSMQCLSLLNHIQQYRVQSQMDMAKTIQAELLPQTFALPFCETIVSFSSSDEVSGDYIDSFSHESNYWIIFGDVSGHGLGAGLVMFMVQSIFTTLIKEQRLIMPADLNAAANTILCSNFERLQEPRPMTIATLYTSNGREFFIHGSHENIFLYKKSIHSFEHFNLSDIPFGIGLTLDLDEDLFQQRQSFTLNVGDILILCTDGIIEAMNSNNKEFGEESLKRIVLQHSQEPLDRIKEIIMEDLNNHMQQDVRDDVSLVMIRSLKEAT